ncbi:MAG: methyl-accepting chemotaxis protein [Thermodesulfobacteria bacterium]|nr:methyl-accepting chemotaxis protein [Thermodesulfobacteriota bacterium]
MGSSSSHPEKQARKRLNLAVKRQLQKWLLIRIGGIILICSMVAALILYLYSRQEISSSFWEAHIQIRRVSDLLFPVLVAGTAVSALAGFILAIFLPQKIAGPIFRIEQDLRVVREGDLTKKIQLREDDILQELAGEINQTTEFFRQQTAKIQQEYATVEELGRSHSSTELINALERMKDVLFRLKV